MCFSKGLPVQHLLLSVREVHSFQCELSVHNWDDGSTIPSITSQRYILKLKGRLVRVAWQTERPDSSRNEVWPKLSPTWEDVPFATMRVYPDVIGPGALGVWDETFLAPMVLSGEWGSMLVLICLDASEAIYQRVGICHYANPQWLERLRPEDIYEDMKISVI